MEIFSAPKQTKKSPGEMSGLRIDRAMKNWELSKAVRLL